MIVKLLGKFKWLLFLAAIISVLSAAAGMATLSLFTDEIEKVQRGGTDFNSSFEMFVILVISVVVLGILSQYILSRLSTSVVCELRNTMTRRLLNTPYAVIERIGGHRVYATLTKDISNISVGMEALPNFVYSLSTALLCVAYLFFLSWELSLLVVSMLAFVIVVAGIGSWVGMLFQEKVREKEDDLFEGMKELVEGGRELNTNRSRKDYFYENQMQPLYEGIKWTSLKASAIFIFLGNWSLGFIFCIIGTVVYGAQYVLGEVPVSLVVSFIMVILFMIDPIQVVFDTMEDFGNYLVSAKKIRNLSLIEDQETTIGLLIENKTSNDWKTIQVKDLIFKYNSGDTLSLVDVDDDDDLEKSDTVKDAYEFSVGPINLEISRGDIIFMTGGNGSGKSTFAKVLVGLYEFSSGSLNFDKGENLTGDMLEWYRSQFSIIFSDFYVFKEVLNKRGELAKDEDILSRLKELKLDDKVSSSDGLLSTLSLSHGQKKRLALLLSYFEDAPINVYDEWAADQDPQFREYFYTKVLPELKQAGKTVVVVTHDDKYFNLCDHLIKFENGTVVYDSKKTSKVLPTIPRSDIRQSDDAGYELSGVLAER